MRYLQQRPNEVVALFRDLLIGVTSFFRDPEAFKALEEKVIPQLFAGKSNGEVIRVWVAGCSTGEEAYSIAILLHERMEALKQRYTLQIFATDLDDRAIAAARAGLYSASIAADLTPERLARYFSLEANGSTYRVHKTIRDVMVFSEQDVIKDPPFSKMDLITCRNLLIYLGPELQRKLIPLFHYSLNSGGWLFLGTSEGVGDFDSLFGADDRKAKLFRRKDDSPSRGRVTFGRFMPTPVTMDAASSSQVGRRLASGRRSLREVTEKALLSHLIVAGALTNAQGDILYLHGRSGTFLEPAPGEAGINNILKMAREGLRRDLSLALPRAVSSKETVIVPGLRVKTNGHFTLVNLTIRPVDAGAGESAQNTLFLIILQEAPPADYPDSALSPSSAKTVSAQGKKPAQRTGAESEARIAALQLELRVKDESLQSTIEELESSTEELKSSSEEMQSVNEELQSTNEELETSKEELQSVNEELATVNTELQSKVADLSQANNDMNNLLAGTGIGTVFVDHQLRILRFTPAARTIINLITTDIGRPVAHLVSNLVGYRSMVADVQAVLDTLETKEVPVETVEGRNFIMRIQPYRTLDNVIEGAVISFVDVTELVQSRDRIHRANELLRFAVVLRDSRDAITVQDFAGRIQAWNPAAERLYGWSETEALELTLADRILADQRDEELAKLKALSESALLEPYRTRRLTRSGESLEVSIAATALYDETGKIYAISTTERAIPPQSS